MEQPPQTTTNTPHASPPKQHECTDGDRAQWSGELESHHNGTLLAAFLRGLTSGVASAATKFVLDQLDIHH